jgi:hypothetical protein
MKDRGYQPNDGEQRGDRKRNTAEALALGQQAERRTEPEQSQEREPSARRGSEEDY